MDTLTQLIQLAHPQASIDLRCQLSGAYRVPHAAAPDGIAPFHLVLAGSCRFETARGLVTAQQGDFVLFPRGGVHTILDGGTPGALAAMRMRYDGLLPLRRAGKGAVDVDLLCGHFRHVGGRGELLFRSLPDPLHASLSEEGSPAVLQSMVALMREEVAAQRPGALAIVTALSQTLLTLALRRCGERADGEPGILTLLADARLGASVQALLQEPGRPWTIATLGEAAAMSRASYARRFSETAGMTVFAFMTRARMAMACGLLRSTRRNVGDIGMEVGYQSEAAFGKAFKQHLGEMPGQYRRRHRGAAASAG